MVRSGTLKRPVLLCSSSPIISCCLSQASLNHSKPLWRLTDRPIQKGLHTWRLCHGDQEFLPSGFACCALVVTHKMSQRKSRSKFKSILQGYARALETLDNCELLLSIPPRRSVHARKIARHAGPSTPAAKVAPPPPPPPIDDDKTVKRGNLSKNNTVEHSVGLACSVPLSLHESRVENQCRARGQDLAPSDSGHSSSQPSAKSLTHLSVLEKENCASECLDQQSVEIAHGVVGPPSPKRRRIFENSPGDDSASQNLSFGYFTSHELYRNQLNGSELLKNGHVSLCNLVPPECSLALVTTFETPGLSWMDRVLEQIPQVILVAHSPPNTFGQAAGEQGDDPSLKGAVIGNCQAQALDRPGWFWIAVQPHVGLMHAKILLFRCPQGLRIVVSGNNFTEHQSSRDRDCMYVHDLMVKRDENASDSAVSTGDTELSRLQNFVEELTSSPHHTTWIKEKIDQLFQQISPETLEGKVRFVLSFPRAASVANGPRGDRGGWQQLAHAVSCFRKAAGHSSSYRTFDERKRELEELHLYAMSGSMGDLKPDFLLQMRHAMSGELIVPTTAEWTDIRRTYVLWPSSETTSTMHPLSIIGSGRAMGQDHWKSIPVESRQRIFFDAVPSPNSKALGDYHAFAHGKAILVEQETAWGAVYVGSHNFSKKAWGLKNAMPGNVEFGVVLFTQDNHVLDEWRSRLPYQLPEKNSISSSNYDLGRMKDADVSMSSWNDIYLPLSILDS